MAKTPKSRTLTDVLSLLGNQQFDVAAAQEGASRSPAASTSRTQGAVRISKYNCAAEIGPGAGGSVALLARPGYLLNGEISRLLDKGYQKFLKSSKLEIPATADHLRALHHFSNELNAATGEMTLYNDSLGTTTDRYLYDRVAGRPDTRPD